MFQKTPLNNAHIRQGVFEFIRINVGQRDSDPVWKNYKSSYNIVYHSTDNVTGKNRQNDVIITFDSNDQSLVSLNNYVGVQTLKNSLWLHAEAKEALK